LKKTNKQITLQIRSGIAAIEVFFLLAAVLVATACLSLGLAFDLAGFWLASLSFLFNPNMFYFKSI
jgi:hypothetical protein